MNICLNEQSYTTCNTFPMIPADSDEIIHQEYLNHDIPWLSSSNYFKKILIQTRQPGNHPWSILSSQPATTTRWRSWWVPRPRSGQQVEVPSILSAPKRDLCLWNFPEKNKKRDDILKTGLMGKLSVSFFRSNECFKKFIAVSWSSLNPFIFVPKSLMVVYSIHSISQAKIIIHIGFGLGFLSYGPMFCVAGDPSSHLVFNLPLGCLLTLGLKLRMQSQDSREDLWGFMKFMLPEGPHGFSLNDFVVGWELSQGLGKSQLVWHAFILKKWRMFSFFWRFCLIADYSACKVVESEA